MGGDQARLLVLVLVLVLGAGAVAVGGMSVLAGRSPAPSAAPAATATIVVPTSTPTLMPTSTPAPLSPPVLVEAPTPTPTPIPTPIPTPTPVLTGSAGCTLTPPPDLDEVETAFWVAFENAFCEGDEAVAVIRCEGWNASANFDLAFISRTDDVGPAQINWVHGQPGGIIEGRWPGAVQSLEGNLDAAMRLRGRAGSWVDWANSRHCHGVW